MGNSSLTFHHIHIISEDPLESANWYVDNLGATFNGEKKLFNVPQIDISLSSLTILIRGRRPGETPAEAVAIKHFEGYSSHNGYGTDHFGFNYHGDMRAYCEDLRAKGVTFSVEPWEIFPGVLICDIAAPDGVSIEVMEVR